jgi:hypothetical protein
VFGSSSATCRKSSGEYISLLTGTLLATTCDHAGHGAADGEEAGTPEKSWTVSPRPYPLLSLWRYERICGN